jgi:hypothetical protein
MRKAEQSAADYWRTGSAPWALEAHGSNGDQAYRLKKLTRSQAREICPLNGGQSVGVNEQLLFRYRTTCEYSNYLFI